MPAHGQEQLSPLSRDLREAELLKSSIAKADVEQAAQGSGRVTIPGNDQKMCGCGTWGPELMVVLAVLV